MKAEPDSFSLLSRREAISRLMLLMGGAIVGAEFFVNGTRVSGKQTTPDFSDTEVALMDEIAETIIPTTDTPGAKAAKVGAFMAMMVNECYDDAQHATFRAGLSQIDEAGRVKYGKSFLAASPTERTFVLNQINAAARPQKLAAAAHEPVHYFTMIRQLVILGYFTSEIGCTQALRYVEAPGAYRGNEPYKKGERAWFNSPARPVR